jgi:uncharacterized protein (DUF1810 family)
MDRLDPPIRARSKERVFQEVLDQYFDGESDDATTSRL